MRLKLATIALVAAGLLAVAPAAEAGKYKLYAPPGKAGSSEYTEVVPTAGGNTLTPAVGGGNRTAAAISRLGAGKQGVRKLAELGKQGAAAATFARQTAPVAAPHALPRVAGASHASAGATLTAGGSALSGLLHLLGGSDSGGIGVFLPLLLALSLGAAIAAAGLRGRRGRRSA